MIKFIQTTANFACTLYRDRSPGSTWDCRVLPGISSRRLGIAGWPGGLRRLCDVYLNLH